MNLQSLGILNLSEHGWQKTMLICRTPKQVIRSARMALPAELQSALSKEAPVFSKACISLGCEQFATISSLI